MTVPKAATRSSSPRQNYGDKLKDEVYRQMFRLESNRPIADLDLATALLRGWLASSSEPEVSNLREWLKRVSPLCLRMIEAKQKASDADQQRIQ